MTEYVKSQNSKIATVQYDWNSVDEVIVGNGLPKGAGRKIQIFRFRKQSFKFRFSNGCIRR